MIVCVPVTGDGSSLELDSRLGRAATLALVDSESGRVRLIGNPQNLRAAQGAGIQTAQRIVEEGAGVVIVANCGPKAFAVLRAAGVRVFLAARGVAGELVSQWKAGQLPEMTEANVEGHWA